MELMRPQMRKFARFEQEDTKYKQMSVNAELVRTCARSHSVPIGETNSFKFTLQIHGVSQKRSEQARGLNPVAHRFPPCEVFGWSIIDNLTHSQVVLCTEFNMSSSSKIHNYSFLESEKPPVGHFTAGILFKLIGFAAGFLIHS